MNGLDCGDNSCMFTEHKGEMRTNGGCRCLTELPPAQQLMPAVNFEAFLRSRKISRRPERSRTSVTDRRRMADERTGALFPASHG
jgi:hypothetical protein